MAIIIVEGCDFTGKSTLVDQLAKSLKAVVYRECNIPSPGVEAAKEWLDTVRVLGRSRTVICDRSPLISEPIYGPTIRGFSSIFFPESVRLMGELPDSTITIWCDPGKEEVLKCNNEQMVGVHENLERIYDSYQATYRHYLGNSLQLFKQLHLSYNWRKDDLTPLIRRINRAFAESDNELMMVEHMHAHFGINHSVWGDSRPKAVQSLSPEVAEFRLKFLREELRELEESLQSGDLVGSFDALLDIAVVLKGTAALMNISPRTWAQGFKEVQRANMSKERVSSAGESKRGSSLDLRKPEGWVSPEGELAELLAEQGLGL